MNNKSVFYIISIVGIFFAAFSSFFSAEWNRWGLYVALPIACVSTFILTRSILVNNHVIRLWGLFLWIIISIPFAKYTDLAIRELHQILGVVLITYLFGGLSKNIKIVPWLYFTYVILYLSALYYAETNIIYDITFGQDRLGDEKLNANMLAYYTFFLTFVVFMLGEIVNNLPVRKIFRYVFFLIIPLSFWIAMFTASRQVFVIQIPLISVLLYWRYLKESKAIYQVLFVASVIIGFIILFPRVQSIYEGSILQVRNSRSLENDVRIKLIVDSFMVGVSHFFTGVGAGNYQAYSFDGHFSHNSFLELFANNGIVGLILIVRIYYIFIRDQFKRYKLYKDTIYLYFFIFGVFFLIDSMFYVFHAKIWLMGFFILVASHSDVYFNKHKELVIADNEKAGDNN